MQVRRSRPDAFKETTLILACFGIGTGAVAFPAEGSKQVLVAGKKAIYDRVMWSALESLLAFGLWTFLLAVALFLIFRELVTRHLVRLADHTRSISFDTHVAPVVLDREHSSEEMDRV